MNDFGTYEFVELPSTIPYDTGRTLTSGAQIYVDNRLKRGIAWVVDDESRIYVSGPAFIKLMAELPPPKWFTATGIKNDADCGGFEFL